MQADYSGYPYWAKGSSGMRYEAWQGMQHTSSAPQVQVIDAEHPDDVRRRERRQSYASSSSGRAPSVRVNTTSVPNYSPAVYAPETPGSYQYSYSTSTWPQGMDTAPRVPSSARAPEYVAASVKYRSSRANDAPHRPRYRSQSRPAQPDGYSGPSQASQEAYGAYDVVDAAPNLSQEAAHAAYNRRRGNGYPSSQEHSAFEQPSTSRIGYNGEQTRQLQTDRGHASYTSSTQEAFASRRAEENYGVYDQSQPTQESSKARNIVDADPYFSPPAVHKAKGRERDKERRHRHERSTSEQPSPNQSGYVQPRPSQIYRDQRHHSNTSSTRDSSAARHAHEPRARGRSPTPQEPDRAYDATRTETCLPEETAQAGYDPTRDHPHVRSASKLRSSSRSGDKEGAPHQQLQGSRYPPKTSFTRGRPYMYSEGPNPSLEDQKPGPQTRHSQGAAMGTSSKTSKSYDATMTARAINLLKARGFECDLPYYTLQTCIKFQQSKGDFEKTPILAAWTLDAVSNEWRKLQKT